MSLCVSCLRDLRKSHVYVFNMCRISHLDFIGDNGVNRVIRDVNPDIFGCLLLTRSPGNGVIAYEQLAKCIKLYVIFQTMLVQ